MLETTAMASPPTCPLTHGTYSSPLPTDLRSPCPIINALANHGHLPRDGRSIHRHDLRAAMTHLGVGASIRALFTYASFLEHADPAPTGFWAFVRHPAAYFLRRFGLRDTAQTDARGRQCLDLDQLSRHGAIEHDVSLSRRDKAQGDNHSRDAGLVAEILARASDGKVVTTEDFVALRQRRLERQRRDNPELEYGTLQHQLACGEAALLQTLFGGEGGVPVAYLRALFAEERLPLREGWRKRGWWWELGFVELTWRAQVLKGLIGNIT